MTVLTGFQENIKTIKYEVFKLNILKAILMGIIQGVTEFLPVSSSGHLSLFRHFFNVESEASGLFSAMLHIGTLVAVLVAFYKPIYELYCEFILCIKDVFAKRFTFKLSKMSPTRRMLFMFVISCIPLLLLLLPVGGGKNLMDAVNAFSTDNSILAEGICFAVTGFLLLLGTAVTENASRYRRVGPLTAFIIGTAQLFAACFPGISRSGSTISAGLCCRVSKKEMVRYSFILSVPAVLASGLVEFKDALSAETVIPVAPLVAGVITSAVVGLFSIRLLQLLLKKNKFKYFGYYCAGLGVIVTVVGVVEKIIGVN